jgi:ribosomal protein S18 acetylase RimI-like enzyme
MGVGTRLVQRCLNILETELPEVKEAYLHVQTSNDEAIEFYKRFGFEVGEVLENYYTRIDPPHAVILRRKL